MSDEFEELAWLCQKQEMLNCSLGMSKNVLDTKDLVAIIGNLEVSQIRNVLDLFVITAEKDLALCRQYLAEQNVPEIALSMHKLKSSAHMIGARQFAGLAQKLEEAARMASDDDMASLLASLEQALAGVKAAVSGQCQFLDRAIVAKKPMLLDCCVLVLDSDAEARWQTAQILAMLGLKDLELTACGNVALTRIMQPELCTSLLLCDVSKSEKEGIQFLGKLREINYQGGVILVVGKSTDDNFIEAAVRLAISQGLFLIGGLDKPVDADALFELINNSSGLLTNKQPEVNLSKQSVLEVLANNEFDVLFQLQCNAFSLQPVAVEAVAYWRRQGELVPADEFMLAAEQYGLAGQVSEIMLIKAFLAGEKLAAAGFPLTLAINLSASWLSVAKLPDFIQASLYATGMRKENVLIEVAETTLMQDWPGNLDKAIRLHSKGYRLAVDKFGTGNLSLRQLQDAHFNELKLASAFIKRATKNVVARKMLATSVGMAAKLNMTTVAEGVDTQQELDLLRELGCGLVQGNFISNAMPIDELIAKLWDNKI